MARIQTNVGAMRRKATSNSRGASSDPPGLTPADLRVPRVIEVEGNEEFLDRISAIFAEQVLEARAEERERRLGQDQER